DERPDQPGPDGALMVRAVALTDAAPVVRRVARLARSERAEPERRHQPRLDGVDDTPGTLAVEDLDGQTAHGEDLIGPDRRVDAVVQRACGSVPEARGEGSASSRLERPPALRSSARDVERVQPQRLHLDGLADPRRDDAIAHPGVHPGELDAGLAGSQEPVAV